MCYQQEAGNKCLSNLNAFCVDHDRFRLRHDNKFDDDDFPHFRSDLSIYGRGDILFTRTRAKKIAEEYKKKFPSNSGG